MKPGKRDLRTFAGLRRIIATLRGPGGCPWDRVQTHESLRPYLLEEVSEALAALASHTPGELPILLPTLTAPTSCSPKVT